MNKQGMTEEEIEKITGGKKLTWKQWNQKLKAYQEKMAAEGKTEPNYRRIGVCECGNASFSHRIVDHRFFRVCKCGKEVEM